MPSAPVEGVAVAGPAPLEAALWENEHGTLWTHARVLTDVGGPTMHASGLLPGSSVAHAAIKLVTDAVTCEAIVRWLAANGGDLNASDGEGASPLDVAVWAHRSVTLLQAR